jgi:hypothetical protein
MPPAELLLRATAWISLVAWTVSEWARTRASSSRDDASGRAAFTLGGLALVVHSALAFELRHGWSHAAALRDTARQTEALLGRPFGIGLFVNYFFLALWTLEAAWWWLDAARYRGRAFGLDGSVRAFFLFMFLNGAVVFAHGPLRALGAAAVLLVAASWYRRAGAEGHGG